MQPERPLCPCCYENFSLMGLKSSYTRPLAGQQLERRGLGCMSWRQDGMPTEGAPYAAYLLGAYPKDLPARPHQQFCCK